VPVGVQGGATPAPLQLVPSPAAAPSKRKVGSRLPEDWQPKPEMVAAYASGGVDAMASLKRFKNHWLAATGKGSTKADWDRTFENWVDKDISDGVAKKFEPKIAPSHAFSNKVVDGKMVTRG